MSTRPPRAALAALCLPMLIVSMDVSVLFFAVPFIASDLNPSATQQLWIFDIYGFVLAGLLFLEHGLIKMIGFPGPGPETLPPMILIAGLIETFGGLLLVLGLFTRPAAFLSSGLMAAAYWCAETAKFELPVRTLEDTPQGLVQVHRVPLGVVADELEGREIILGVRPEQISLGKLNNVREALDICRTSRTSRNRPPCSSPVHGSAHQGTSKASVNASTTPEG